MRAKPSVKNNCLVAVDIRSAHNVGSLFRSCDGFKADLFLVGICPAPRYNGDQRLPHIAIQAEKQIAKTALGAEKSINWDYAEDFITCVEQLKAKGYRIVALEQHKKSKELKNLHSGAEPIALVVGREVEGLRNVELGLCDDFYEIPMQGSKESFNVAVAAGIGLYQLSL